MHDMKKKKLAVAVNAALMLTLGTTPVWGQQQAADNDQNLEQTEVSPKPAKGTEKENSEAMETVEVLGIRGSLQDNLNNKRYSNAIKDALNTEDIDKNPDKNLAEALQRISGVQITRDFGEGATISIRGTNVNFTNTLLNGQSMKSAQSLPLRDEMNAFDFSSVAAEQVSQIEVYKSPQADLDAGGIGGTVILKTKKPLDRPSGDGYLKFENSYNDGSGQNSPQMGALYNWKTDDNKFGASANISYQELNLQRDGNEAIAGWWDYYLDGVPTQVVNSIDDTAIYHTRTLDGYERSGAMWGIPGSARFERDRKRMGGTVSFQYRPSDNLDFNLEYTRNHTDDPNSSHNLYARAYKLARSAYSTGGEPEPGYEVDRVADLLLHAEQDIYDVQNVNSAGIRYWGTPTNLINMEFQDRDGSEKTSDMLNFTTNWSNESFEVKAQLGRSTGKSHIDDFGTHFGLNIDYVDDNPDMPVLDNGLAGVSMYYDYDPDANLAGWGVSGDGEWLKHPTTEMSMRDIFKTVQDRENTENFAQLDTLWTLQEPTFFVESIKFGLKHRDISASNVRSAASSRLADGVEVLAGDLAGGVVSGIREDLGVMPTAYFDVDTAKRDALWNDGLLLVDDLGACNDLIATAGGNYQGCRTDYLETVSQFYDQEQQVNAFYTMLNFAGERFRGNIGVRVVDTERESLTRQADGVDENGDTLYRDVITDSSTTDVLPSMNFSYDLTEDLLLRTAASKVISHPALYQIRDGFSVIGNYDAAGALLGEGAQRTGAKGNPDLKSYEAEQFEIGTEWYFTESSMVGITAFYKDISNLIRKQLGIQDLTGSGYTDAFGNPVDGEYAITSYYNVGKQAINGYEIQLQHDFNNGFGVLANYTFVNIPMEEFTTQSIEAQLLQDANGVVVDSSDRPTVIGYEATNPEIDEVRTPGNSEDTINLSAYYESDRFSARLSYNYRSMYFDSIDSQASRVIDDTEQVDLKLTYSITENLTAALSAYNLTNENKNYYLLRDQLEAPEGGVPAGLEPYYTDRAGKVAHNTYETGRRYFASLNWKF
ncbi:TonB-dependent receptor [uncultured Microbulbifer sp.]|uniref:TonB-dependent receptor n=1 Tax=uncultured Microbulbifer sp. TaxID=348147 RepID=UPI0025D524C3|nr:TonB-dependent receptor [uncultured Microbulbifer sp.]